MSNRLYELFCSKLPTTATELVPWKRPLLVTFLNPYGLQSNNTHTTLYENFDYIASDGILPVWLLRIFGHKVRPRISFDMSSLAPHIFDYCIKENKSIYFIGSTQINIQRFIQLIHTTYPSLQILGYRDGYIQDHTSDTIENIKNCHPDIVVIGMGTPLQDLFAIELHDKGFHGSIYTCGGFFHQTTQKIKYYPNWINRLHLRALYRAFKEPHIFSRIVRHYPSFIIKFSIFCCRNISFNS